MKKTFAALLSTLFLVLGFNVAHADYTFTAIDVPGATLTYANGINNSGEVVGSFAVPGEGYSGFVRDSGGTYTTVKVGDGNTFLTGINNSGQIVGTGIKNDHTDGFVRSTDGTELRWIYNGSFSMLPSGINDNGDIVGYYTGILSQYAFFYNTNEAKIWHIQDSEIAYAINNKGAIAVYNGLQNMSRIYSWPTKTVVRAVQYPGAVETYATGINNSMQIVGYFYQDGITHGFLCSDSDCTIIDNPDGVGGTFLTGINDNGQIVGYYQDAEQNVHGFIGNMQSSTPVPEPGTMLLLGFGLAGVAVASCRGRARRKFGK